MKLLTVRDPVESQRVFDLSQFRVKLLDHYRWLHSEWPGNKARNRRVVFATLVVRHGIGPVLRHCRKIEEILNRVEEEE